MKREFFAEVLIKLDSKSLLIFKRSQNSKKVYKFRQEGTNATPPPGNHILQTTCLHGVLMQGLGYSAAFIYTLP
jgi:hypothetical protein